MYDSPPLFHFGAAVFAFAALQAKTGAGGGTRTHTTFYGPRILSPVRLPFRHTGFHGKTLIAKRPKRKRELARGLLNRQERKERKVLTAKQRWTAET
jgi:hypothetical protein